MILRWTDTRDSTEYQVRVVGWSTIAFWNRDGFWVTGLTSGHLVEELEDGELMELLDAAKNAKPDSS